jgi:hypothetical protein
MPSESHALGLVVTVAAFFLIFYLSNFRHLHIMAPSMEAADQRINGKSFIFNKSAPLKVAVRHVRSEIVHFDLQEKLQTSLSTNGPSTK